MTLSIQIDRPPYPNEEPSDFPKSSYSGGIIFNIDGKTITKRKGCQHKTSAADFLFAFFSKCIKAIPLLIKGKEVICNLYEQPSVSTI